MEPAWRTPGARLEPAWRTPGARLEPADRSKSAVRRGFQIPYLDLQLLSELSVSLLLLSSKHVDHGGGVVM
ncbi:unnamed protein product [Boreogadus saida]